MNSQTLPELATMRLCIVRYEHIESLLEDGDHGDIQARKLVYAVHDWMKAYKRANETGNTAGCAWCEQELLGEDDVGGWVMLVPDDARPGYAGYVGAYCEDCIERDRDQLMDKFVDYATKNFGLAVAVMH